MTMKVERTERQIK